MRRFIPILFACASGFAGTIQTSVTCDGVTYFGSGSASCGDNQNVGASALATDQFVDVGVFNAPLNSASAWALFSMDYVLTVFGGSGDGFAEPQLEALSAPNFGQDSSAAGADLGCEALAEGGDRYNTCTPTSLPFVFGVPQTLTLSMDAQATASNYGYDSMEANAGFGGFWFYVNGQPFDATYTFTPVPEPGMFPLLAAMACAALIAKRLHNR